METYRLGKVIRHTVSSVSGIRLEYSLFRSARRIGGRYSYSIALHQTVCGESEDVYAGDVFTTPASLAGVPSLSLPVGLSKNGLPIGLQVIGKHFDENTVFQVSNVLEKLAQFDQKPHHVKG